MITGFSRPLPLAMVLAMVLLSSGCSDVKRSLGLTRNTPDAFAVVRQAPLVVPPDYELRPPRPGAQRPQEISTQERARVTVFGQETERAGNPLLSQGEQKLLDKAGAEKADPNIVEALSAETAETESIVDASAEAERLRKNQKEGRAPDEGETPTIEPSETNEGLWGKVKGWF